MSSNLAAEMPPPLWETEYRIPSDTQPLHYDVYLHPNVGGDSSASFSGKVGIVIECQKPREFLVVHAQNLNVTSTLLTRKSSEGDENSDEDVVIAIKEAFEFEPNQFWVVKPASSPLAPGTYTLTMEFNGRLDNGILGFYKSVYRNEMGEERAIATSKFQPTYARRAFPCFDEPSFKSTFTTTLVRPSGDGYVALSNMPEASSVADAPRPGLTEVTFQKSVPMVTYLAIFVVCDFPYLETASKHGQIPMRIYGTRKNQPYLSYAAEISPVITDFYQSYFGIEYPLPKLDMAAIPDYSSGATEHWGLVTYRETNLVFDPRESSFQNKVRVADVIAHELAHQWFGNLMTVHWWNDLWLNEGFATYIEYKGVHSHESGWDMESKFLTDDLHPVMELDATRGSHPIVTEVRTPDQINAVFDAIAYSKGASVIRMMEDMMASPEEFRQGLHNFLVKFKYKTAVTEDLLDQLTAVSSQGLDVAKIMDTWTRQKGYPVLTLTKKNKKSSEEGMCSYYYTVKQKRFLADPAAAAASPDNDDDDPSPFNYKWQIPVTYISSKDEATQPRKLVWFDIEHEQVTVPFPEGCDWVKLNAGQRGYYRVNYPAEDWARFADLLTTDPTALSSSDRANLINDAFSLANVPPAPPAADNNDDELQLAYSTALGLTKYLKKETSLAPWTAALTKLKRISDLLYYSDIFPMFNQFMCGLVRPVCAELGWSESEEEDDASGKQSFYDRVLLRPLVVGTLCAAGDQDCLAKARGLFLQWKENESVISPDMRAVVYTHGMSQVADFDTWKWMLQRYQNENNPQEKIKLMRGLASVRVPWILSHLLEVATGDASVFRSQDYFTLLTFVSWNRVGEPLVWDFVRTNWDRLVARFTLNDRLFGRFLHTMTDRFATPLRLREMRDFFAAHPRAGAGENYRKIALETVEANIKFAQSKYKDIKAWLLHNHKDN